MKLSLPVLLPSTLLLFFHLAGGLQGLAKTLTFLLMASAWVAKPHWEPQLPLPESSMPRRRMERPAWPFTWLEGDWLESSDQKVSASEDEKELSHWLDAPNPEMVW